MFSEFVFKLYFEIILDLYKSCKNSTEFQYTFTQHFFILTFYVAIF